MSDSSPPDRQHQHFRRAVAVPTARRLEGFVWLVVWFALVVKILLFS